MKSMKIPPEEDLRLRMIQLVEDTQKEHYVQGNWYISLAEQITDAILAFLKKEPIK